MTNPHGGDIYTASKLYGYSKEEFLDYSANINPFGVPEGLKLKIISSLDELSSYPDTECSLLKQQISSYLKMPEENIIIGNGATEIIFLLFEVMQPKKVIIPAPAFCEYAEAAKRYGTEVEYFEIMEDTDYRLDVQRLIERIDINTETIMLCSPNNPTSKLVDKEDLLYLIEYALNRNINVIIDETFIELTEGNNSIVNYVLKYNNLFVIRAFTKLFAIPGLRLGYGLGSEKLIKELWKKKLPWSVNSLAFCAAEFLMESGEYLKKTAEWINLEIEWFFNQLAEIPGLKVFKPETNFVLVKLLDEGWDSYSLKEKLALKGILIRDASNFMFLNERFIRFAIKDRESNTRFLKILKEIL